MIRMRHYYESIHSYLDYFPENRDDFREKNGERSQRDMKTKEVRYRGGWDTYMMALLVKDFTEGVVLLNSVQGNNIKESFWVT